MNVQFRVSCIKLILLSVIFIGLLVFLHMCVSSIINFEVGGHVITY